jgi:hypothetical protein
MGLDFDDSALSWRVADGYLRFHWQVPCTPYLGARMRGPLAARASAARARPNRKHLRFLLSVHYLVVSETSTSGGPQS